MLLQKAVQRVCSRRLHRRCRPPAAHSAYRDVSRTRTVGPCVVKSAVNDAAAVTAKDVQQEKQAEEQQKQDEPSSSSNAAPMSDAKSDEYSEVMNRKMGTSLHYRHELGIDYNRILPDLIVGSCLQTAADVDRLAEQEGVTTVFCLQEDSDMAYFDLDIASIQERCKERGDIKHVRFPIRDFDPEDLRRKLPKAVSRLAKEHSPSRGGTVYIHCTAGMGRAPATAIAYMNWCRGIQLDEAVHMVKSVRQCGPKIEAIRSATSDLLLGVEPIMTTIAVHRFGSAKRVQVAGLDVGWNNPLDMHRDPVTKRFILNRQLHPGKYMYKLIVDGAWTVSPDHPVSKDGQNMNNTLEVIPKAMTDEQMQKQLRILSEGSKLTEEEQAALQDLLCPWRNTESLQTLAPGDYASDEGIGQEANVTDLE